MMLRPRCVEACKLHKNAVLAIIILPSRELAQQVFQVAKKMLHYLHTTYCSSLSSSSSCTSATTKVTTELSKSNTTSKTSKKAMAIPNFSYQCFIGGRDIQLDVDAFNAQGANLLLGTPGRLFELLVSSRYT
uniref:DEAD-box ATP-dependent RNA helicase 49 n=1 Tax=Lygus hesperus TaxID=30085 RepID=A0A0A9XC94_LYGHE